MSSRTRRQSCQHRRRPSRAAPSRAAVRWAPSWQPERGRAARAFTTQDVSGTPSTPPGCPVATRLHHGKAPQAPVLGACPGHLSWCPSENPMPRGPPRFQPQRRALRCGGISRGLSKVRVGNGFLLTLSCEPSSGWPLGVPCCRTPGLLPVWGTCGRSEADVLTQGAVGTVLTSRFSRVNPCEWSCLATY